MVEIPHERGDLKVPLICERQDVGFFHNGCSMRMVVGSCDNSQSFFCKSAILSRSPWFAKPHTGSPYVK